MVLVARDVDRRDLALPERVVKRIVDLADRDPELRGGVATLAENARQADARGDRIVKMSLPMGADLARS